MLKAGHLAQLGASSIDSASTGRLKPPLPLDEEETLYSIGSRYHLLSGSRSDRRSALDLLGHRRGRCLHEVPVGLNHLEKVSQGRLTLSEALLRQRTVLAAFLPFSDDRARARILSICAGGASHDSIRRSGFQWREIPRTRYLRLCPECLVDDERLRGTVFWRNQHQLPGVWACTRHGVTLRAITLEASQNSWVRPDLSIATISPSPAAAHPGGALFRVAESIGWLASKSRVSIDALRVMVRSRLAGAGFARSDVTVSANELERFHMSTLQPMAELGVPQLSSIGDAGWVRPALVDRRASHPLKWALLLAATGPTDRPSMERSYEEAESRVPQLVLAEESTPRRTRAPDRLYLALSEQTLLSDASRAAAMSMGEAQRWLRRDRELGIAWRAAKIDRRRTSARSAVLAYLTSHPQALRSAVIKDCGSDVRWLQQQDTVWIEAVLPKPVAHLDKQLRFES
jgi:hypothetical protein